MTKLGDIATEITSPASDDKLYIWDTSAAAGSRDGFVEIANIFNALDNELGFWADGVAGSTQYRLRDRVFIGDAADFDGNETSSANSWLGDLGDGDNTMIWLEQNATIASISSRGLAGVFASRATDSPGTTGANIGVVGYAYNNLEESGHGAWGAYIEGVRDTDGGNTVAAEFDITNLAETPRTVRLNPFNTWTAGTTVGVHIASGGDATVWPTSYDADAALVFSSNGALFSAGMVVRGECLVRDDGATGKAHAISMGYDHLVEWYEYTTNTLAAYVTSNIADANHDQGLIFYAGGLKYVNGAGNTVFLAQDNQNTVANYLYVAGEETGTSPFMAVAGSDSNIDLRLIPKGTGKIRFGGYTAATMTATGYITIKDAGGTERKVLVGTS